MSQRKISRPSPEFFSRDEAARIFGVSVQQIDARHAKLDPAAVTKLGQRVWLNIPKIVAALIAEAEAKAAEKLGGDPLLAGTDATDSPALERYRDYRAKLARLEFEEREGSHVPIADIDGALVRFGNRLRMAGEVLQRRWGNEAADVLNEAITDALKDYERSKGNGDHHQQ